MGEFVSRSTFADLPQKAIDTAKLGFTDTIATMMAGRNEPVVRILTDVLDPAAGPSSIAFSGRQALATDAALINGAAAHALDYDDVALRGHISRVLVPSILAYGQELDVSGQDKILAYAIGYETWAELVSREQDFITIRAGIQREFSVRSPRRPPAPAFGDLTRQKRQTPLRSALRTAPASWRTSAP